MKILYLSPTVPSPSGSGGKVAIYKHLSQLQGLEHGVELVIIDNENTRANCPAPFESFKPKIFPPALARAGQITRMLYACFQLAFDWRPWSIALCRPKAATHYLQKILANHRYDVIVVDHLRAFAPIDKIALKTPIIYIAHNIETDLIRQELNYCKPFSPRYFYTYFNWLKLRHYEATLARKAGRLVTISAVDGQHFRHDSALAKKTVIWPELPDIKTERWRYRGSRRMLFVGAARHFPNREAATWLIEELMPRLQVKDPSIRLTIVGIAREQLPSEVQIPNVDFLGFVSDTELAEAHLNSDLFICPVTLGSGIKIKILEAAAFGMPIIATPDSMNGIDFLNGIATVIQRAPSDFASAIIGLLNSPDKLQTQSVATINALTQAIEDRPNLSKLLEDYAG